MDSINNNNMPEQYNNVYDYNNYDDVYGTRYDRRFDDRRYDFDRRFDYDRRYDYDRRFDDRMRYYRFPYCDRYGRCSNDLWWLFWPFFFL